MQALKKNKQLHIAAALAMLCFAGIFFGVRQHIILERVQEDLLLYINPTAERAYSYGLRHFEAVTPEEYDVNRAEYFFRKAEEIDPKYPMVHYQLARIAFLSSYFHTALDLVQVEFSINKNPPSKVYYVRALIEGYMGNYPAAESDYQAYFKLEPANWAAINDYSWVLLKDNLPADAHEALAFGLKEWPQNAWLLVNDATALYEMGHYAEAAEVAKKAIPAVKALTPAVWLIAYPGNDPLIAQTGLDNFKQSSQENLRKILAKQK